MRHLPRQNLRDTSTIFPIITTIFKQLGSATTLVLLVCVCVTTVQSVEASEVNTSPSMCTYTAGPIDSSKLIVGGEILGPSASATSAILIENDKIRRLGKMEELRATAPHARLLTCANVYISPGFVNAHEHPPYSGGKPGPNVKPVYTNRYQWQGKEGVQHVEIAYSRVESDAQLYWIELRHLFAGTTTLAGNGAVPGLIKNVGSGDQATGFIYQADMKTFPFPDASVDFKDLPWPYDGPSVKPELTDGASTEIAYAPHIAEGTDKISKLEAEFFLEYVANNPGRRYAMIHAVGLSRDSVPRLRELDVTVVWSPRSNLALYGNTIDLPYFINNGARIALSTDWSYSGSYNMLESFRCAKHVDKERWGNRLSAKDLWIMATKHPAYALNLEQKIGTVEAGFAADLVILRAKSDDKYQDVIESGISDVVATIVDGQLVSGHHDAFDMSELPPICVNFVGDHFVCDDLATRDFTWQQLLEVNKEAVPLFKPEGQASCTF